jgi:hypothetical protein
LYSLLSVELICTLSETKMAILYDIEGTEIYAGRGKYSRRACSMIEDRVAYKHDDEGAQDLAY